MFLWMRYSNEPPIYITVLYQDSRDELSVALVHLIYILSFYIKCYF